MIAAAGMIAQELATGDKLATFAVMGKKEAKDFDGVAYAKELPGVTEPLGFWDPLGFCEDEDLTEGKLKFYRECELKHGRLGMLAALGFVWRELPPALRRQHRCTGVPRVPADPVGDVLAACGAYDRDPRDLFGLHFRDGRCDGLARQADAAGATVGHSR